MCPVCHVHIQGGQVTTNTANMNDNFKAALFQMNGWQHNLAGLMAAYPKIHKNGCYRTISTLAHQMSDLRRAATARASGASVAASSASLSRSSSSSTSALLDLAQTPRCRTCGCNPLDPPLGPFVVDDNNDASDDGDDGDDDDDDDHDSVLDDDSISWSPERTERRPTSASATASVPQDVQVLSTPDGFAKATRRAVSFSSLSSTGAPSSSSSSARATLGSHDSDDEDDHSDDDGDYTGSPPSSPNQRRDLRPPKRLSVVDSSVNSMLNTYYSMSHVVDVCAPVNAIERAVAAKEQVVVEVAVVALAEAAAAAAAALAAAALAAAALAAAAEQRPALARETRTSSKGGKIRFCG